MRHANLKYLRTLRYLTQKQSWFVLINDGEYAAMFGNDDGARQAQLAQLADTSEDRSLL
jgi:hypothetical protein